MWPGTDAEGLHQEWKRCAAEAREFDKVLCPAGIHYLNSVSQANQFSLFFGGKSPGIPSSN